MTEPLFADPAEVFLSQGALADNLPSTDVDLPPSHHTAAIGLAAAFLAWRTLGSKNLIDNYLHRRSIEHIILETSYETLAKPVYHDLFDEVGVSQADAVAQAHAEQMGLYLESTSKAAVEQAYQAELANGVAPELAWERASRGFGLDGTQMRSWIAAQRANEGNYEQVVTDSAQAALDRGLLTRADLLGQTEAWQARQTGQTLVWMFLEDTGQLPAGCLKKWWTKQDERVCPTCGPLHEQLAVINEPFVLPSEATVWAPGVHPNCRCSLELVYPTKLEGMLEKYLGLTKEDLTRPTNAQLKAAVPKPKKILTPIKLKANTSTPGLLSKIGFTSAWPDTDDDDEYNRDSHGRFATVDTREAEVETKPAEKTTVKPVANPWVKTDDPWAKLSPWGETTTATSPFTSTDPWAKHEPWGKVVDPWTKPVTDPWTKTGTKTGSPNFIINFAAEPPAPDMLAVLPADYYFLDRGSSLGDLSDLGSHTAYDMGTPGRGSLPYNPEGQHIFRVGDEVDLTRAGEPFIGYTFGGGSKHSINTVLNDLSVHYETAPNDHDLFDDSEVTAAINKLSDDIQHDPTSFVSVLTDKQKQRIFYNVGRAHDFLVMSPDESAAVLVTAIENGDEEIINALLANELTHNPPEELAVAATEGEGKDHFQTPQIFTFPGRHQGDWEESGGMGISPRITGRYYVKTIKYHSLVGPGGYAGPEEMRSRVKGWREIQLASVQ